MEYIAKVNILFVFTKYSVIFVVKFTKVLLNMTQSEIEFFDRLAPTWDANEVRSTPERIRNILNLLPLKKGMSVLDLGTGTGVLIPYVEEKIGLEGRIGAVDLSEEMLNLAKSKYGKYENVDFMRIDFEEDPIAGMYDLVILYSVYPHLHYPEDTLEWLFKMNVKDDGAIVIAFPSDEKFINNIHHERKSESDHLPPATVLATTIEEWGYDTSVLADSEDAYVIIIRRKK